MAMSKTAAIKAARVTVSTPIRRSSTEYVIYGPWSLTDIYGNTAERTANTYRAASEMRSRWIANIALGLMGQLSSSAYFAIEDADGGSVEQLVEIGIRANS